MVSHLMILHPWLQAGRKCSIDWRDMVMIAPKFRKTQTAESGLFHLNPAWTCLKPSSLFRTLDCTTHYQIMQWRKVLWEVWKQVVEHFQKALVQSTFGIYIGSYGRQVSFWSLPGWPHFSFVSFSWPWSMSWAHLQVSATVSSKRFRFSYMERWYKTTTKSSECEIIQLTSDLGKVDLRSLWFNSFRITSHDKINFKDFYRYPTFLRVQETGWLHAILFFVGRTYKRR